ncbi:MAG: class I SAM-dependent methyltransferase [Paludibacter sp.]|nr:class I SAM-dependent methyltransferase [Paludibacter sp.]
MQKRHIDRLQYVNEQVISTEKYIVPYIEQKKGIKPGMQVMEIGCGEAGNLKPFLDRGCICTGVDFSEPKIEKGRAFFASHPMVANLKLISEDIYKTNDFDGKFDIIFLRDVIEHIHDQDKFLGLMKKWLSPDGVAFFAFPPWQNPFGGHQQICESKILSHLPYFHLLPMFLYKALLKLFGESKVKVNSLVEIKETGISLEQFEQLYLKNGYEKVEKTLYFINPNYDIKFGLKPRKLNKLIASIPYLKNFFTTTGYYLIKLSRI